MRHVADALDLIHGQRARTNQAHFTAHDVNVLWKFINAEFPKPFANLSYPWVAGDLEYWSGHFIHGGQLMFDLLSVGHHGAEFVDGKRGAIETGAQLTEEYRAGRR